MEQQTATSEILGVIASSPTDIQPVLNVVAENAARLCEADDAVIRRLDGNVIPLVAHYGQIPPGGMDVSTFSRGDVVGRAIIERRAIHVRDLAAGEVANEFPDSKSHRERSGARTFLTMPMLREGTPVGVINIRRQRRLRPFSEKHVALLKPLPLKLSSPSRMSGCSRKFRSATRNCARRWSIKRRLPRCSSIISRSPTDVQPVLDAIVESAARVCGIDDVLLRLRQGNSLVSRAHFGSIPIAIGRVEISIDEPRYRWMREHGALHIPDGRAQNEFSGIGSAGNSRTFLAAPLLQHGELIGILTARRTEVRPFTPVQIRLLETFADQAVIAIENVRLFKELQERNRDLTEALEQQTATSEILRVIAARRRTFSRCWTPLPKVRRVCATRLMLSIAIVSMVTSCGGSLRTGRFLVPPPIADVMESIARTVPGRAVVDRQTIHVHDSRQQRR